jgi:glycosyltransferase involved in cell wall biosynthesis
MTFVNAPDKSGKAVPVKLLYITAVADTQFIFLRGQNLYMAERGFELHSIASPGPLLEKLRDRDGVQIHPVAIDRRGFSLNDLKSLVRIYQVLRQVRPTIVSLGTPKAAFLGAIAAMLARVPIRIFLAHGLISPHSSGWKGWFYRWAEYLTARLCQQTLFVSRSLQALAQTHGIVRSDRHCVLAQGTCNGIDVERFDPGRVVKAALRDEHATPSADRSEPAVIGYVGRLVHDKGIGELAQAWAVLREEFPQARLLLVGKWESEDPLPASVRALLESDRRVILTGHVDNPAPYFKAMTVFAFPSHREGFGLACAEASAMELPVVATEVVGCRDAVQDGVTGTLVPVNDSQALAAALRTYLNDPLRRRRHGKAGRNRIVQSFKSGQVWEAVHHEYLRLLAECGLPLPDQTTPAHYPQRKAA